MIAVLAVFSTLAFLFSKKFKKRWYLCIFFLFSGLFYISNFSVIEINCSSAISSFKPQILNQTPILRKSNSLSYVEAYKLDSRKYLFLYDCAGETRGIKFNAFENYDQLTREFSSFPFHIKKYQSSLIIGSGGGLEAVRGVVGKSEHVTAVEINHLMKDLASEVFIPTENVYNEKNVDLFIMEARNFIARNSQKYDLIHKVRTKSYGGLFIKDTNFLLNYLNTTEAVALYIDHLTEDGILFFMDKKFFTGKYIKVLREYIYDGNSCYVLVYTMCVYTK